MPRPEFGHLRAIPSNAGRDTSKTANTAPDISAGFSLSITICIVRTGLISSPCTPLTSAMRLPGFAPLATIVETCQCCPVAACTP